MKYTELPKDLIKVLKQRYLLHTMVETTWDLLNSADMLVDDEKIISYYGENHEFDEDDFTYNDERRCYSY